MTLRNVVVWTDDWNPETVQVANHLHRQGIPFTFVDLSKEERGNAIKHALKSLGFSTFPVITTDSGAWTGYRPSLTERLHRTEGYNDPCARITDETDPLATKLVLTDGEMWFRSNPSINRADPRWVDTRKMILRRAQRM